MIPVSIPLRRRASGFTLIELLVALGILGIVAAIAIPLYMDYVRRAQVAEAFVLVTKFKPEIGVFWSENVRLPTDKEMRDQTIRSGVYVKSIRWRTDLKKLGRWGRTTGEWTKSGTGMSKDWRQELESKAASYNYGGSVFLKMGGEADAVLTKAPYNQILLTPWVTSDTAITWECASTIAPKYLPEGCHPLTEWSWTKELRGEWLAEQGVLYTTWDPGDIPPEEWLQLMFDKAAQHIDECKAPEGAETDEPYRGDRRDQKACAELVANAMRRQCSDYSPETSGDKGKLATSNETCAYAMQAFAHDAIVNALATTVADTTFGRGADAFRAAMAVTGLSVDELNTLINHSTSDRYDGVYDPDKVNLESSWKTGGYVDLNTIMAGLSAEDQEALVHANALENAYQGVMASGGGGADREEYETLDKQLAANNQWYELLGENFPGFNDALSAAQNTAGIEMPDVLDALMSGDAPSNPLDSSGTPITKGEDGVDGKVDAVRDAFPLIEFASATGEVDGTNIMDFFPGVMEPMYVEDYADSDTIPGFLNHPNWDTLMDNLKENATWDMAAAIEGGGDESIADAIAWQVAQANYQERDPDGLFLVGGFKEPGGYSDLFVAMDPFHAKEKYPTIHLALDNPWNCPNMQTDAIVTLGTVEHALSGGFMEYYNNRDAVSAALESIDGVSHVSIESSDGNTDMLTAFKVDPVVAADPEKYAALQLEVDYAMAVVGEEWEGESEATHFVGIQQIPVGIKPLAKLAGGENEGTYSNDEFGLKDTMVLCANGTWGKPLTGIKDDASAAYGWSKLCPF